MNESTDPTPDKNLSLPDQDSGEDGWSGLDTEMISVPQVATFDLDYDREIAYLLHEGKLRPGMVPDHFKGP